MLGTGLVACSTMERRGRFDLVAIRSAVIDLLLAGHLHMGYSGDVRTHHEAIERSVLSVQAGTATSSRRRGKLDAYNWITVSPYEVIIQVRAWNGDRFEAQIRKRSIRTHGECHEQN